MGRAQQGESFEGDKLRDKVIRISVLVPLKAQNMW